MKIISCNNAFTKIMTIDKNFFSVFVKFLTLARYYPCVIDF